MDLAFLRTNDYVDSLCAVFDERRPARPSPLFSWMEWPRRYWASKLFSHLWDWQIGQLPSHEWLQKGLQYADAMFDRSLPLLKERQRKLGNLLLKGV
jgi:hypothetical protein